MAEQLGIICRRRIAYWRWQRIWFQAGVGQAECNLFADGTSTQVAEPSGVQFETASAWSF